MGRDLSPSEKRAARAAIESVSALVLQAAGKDEEWAEGLDSTPEAFKVICVEKAVLRLANPAGLESQTETLGSYSHTERYGENGSHRSLALTRSERARVRTAAGRIGVSSPSTLDDDCV